MTDNSSRHLAPTGDDEGIARRAARTHGSWPLARTLIRHPWVRASGRSSGDRRARVGSTADDAVGRRAA